MFSKILTIGLLLVLIYRTWKGNKDMSEALDKLTAEVAEMDTVVDSAISTIKGLAQQIRDAMGEPAALQRLADDLDAKSVALAAAIAESTTTVTPPVPPEPVDPEPLPVGEDTSGGTDTGAGEGGDDTLSGGNGEDSVADPAAGDDSAAGSDTASGSTIGGAGGSDIVG